MTETLLPTGNNCHWVTLDGNHAATYTAYAFSDCCSLYPITPASTMAEAADEMCAEGKKNIFGRLCECTQMQSEGGASGALHGNLLSGNLCSTFTCSQGLMLMIPEMFKIAGELQPTVFHVSCRVVGGQAMNISADHTDIMSTRQTGFSMLCSNSVQEVLDIGAAAHLTTIQASVPIMHFFDGFRVSHEVSKVQELNYSDLAKLYDYEALARWREQKAMRNDKPSMRALVEDKDVYWNILEAANPHYQRIPELLQANLNKIAELTGRQYHLFDYYGAADATDVIVIMGSACGPAEEYIELANSQGKKYGLIKVHLYRPFSAAHLAAALPATCRHLSVLDRTKEYGSVGEPLYLDVLAALSQEHRLAGLEISAGRYGIGGKDFTPVMCKSVFDNMNIAKPITRFTVGINDDVNHISLPIGENIPIPHPGMTQAKFYGFGADGTVGSCKNSISIIGDNTPLYAQGHFAYDAKKSGGVTISHLRFGPQPIKMAYEIVHADYIACHHHSYPRKYDMLASARDGAVFVLNCPFATIEDLEHHLPGQMRAAIASKHLKFYVIDADACALRCGMRGRVNMVMQTVFFNLSGVLPMEQAVKLLKDAIVHMYHKKGDDVVKKNFAMVDCSLEGLHQIDYPATWTQATFEPFACPADATDYYKNFASVCLRLEGDKFPVSGVNDFVGGIFPTNTTRFEKRGVSAQIPTWDAEKCIACNMCSMVCPHACIRPFLVTPEEKAHAPNPACFTTKASKKEGFEFRVSISPADCLGCEACVNTCPKKALTMTDPDRRMAEDRANWDYVSALPNRGNLMWNPEDPAQTVPSMGALQYHAPLMEFSSACAGCAESPAIKLLLQLFGERVMVANACGCSMVFCGYLPTSPYGITTEGLGPCYSGSLFEDNAELAYGMATGSMRRRGHLLENTKKALAEVPATLMTDALKNAMNAWVAAYNDPIQSKKTGFVIRDLLAAEGARGHELLQQIYAAKDLFQRKSYWAVGGDGWAYDIGFGGLDQVLNMGAKLNVLVLDTEVYSNTGGQKSKGTPRGAIARFAAAGKDSKKKDLGAYAMGLGSVYVATVSLGANMQQMIKAFVEAENYPGTSIIVAYCPCINHGLKQGQGTSAQEQKLAVQTGYWPLYRYNPTLKAEGKNPLIIDSPAPSVPLSELLKREVRFASLQQQSPETATKLHAELQSDINERIAALHRLHASLEPVAPVVAAPQN